MATARYAYKCTECDKALPREQLTVKKVVFQKMGAGGKIVRSRVVHWLCRPCLTNDDDYNRAEFGHNKEVSR